MKTVAYYERLIASRTRGSGHDEGEQKEGLRCRREFARLFLVPWYPGWTLRRGAGPDTIDGLSRLVQWVEQGIAPDQIIVSKVVNGVTAFSRPVCPYPALPRYKGGGDATKAGSFVCVADSDRDNNQPPAPKYVDDGSRLTTATTVRRVTRGESVILGARI